MSNCQTFPVTGLGTECKFPLEVARRLYLMPLTKANGDANEWATVSEVTEANLTVAIEAGDLFPLPLIDNVEDLQGDPTIYEYASSSKEFIKDGVRDFKGYIPSAYSNTNLLKRLEQITGQEFGTCYIDKKASFVYSADDGLKVKPIVIEGASWYARLIKPTYEEPLMIEIAFNFSQDIDDGDLALIVKDDLDFDGLNQNQIYGLAPLYTTVTAQTTANIVVNLTTAYNVGVSGFVLADFSYVPDGGSNEIDAVVETPSVPGEYTLTPSATFTTGAGILTTDKVKYEKTSDVLNIA